MRGLEPDLSKWVGEALKEGLVLKIISPRADAQLAGIGSEKLFDGREVDVFQISVAGEPGNELTHQDMLHRVMDRSGVIRIDFCHPAGRPDEPPTPVLQTFGGKRLETGRWLVQYSLRGAEYF